MYWPSSTDPFYLANPTDNGARQTYYNITGTPTMKCDGTTASWTSIQSTIQSRMTVASPLWLDLSATVNGNNLIVTTSAVANQTISGNYVMQIVLLDRYSYLPNSPNGQPHHYHAMLKMAPTASGQAFSAAANDTVHHTATIALNPSWQIANLDIACFVQNNTSKEVIQSHCEQVPVNFPGLYFVSYTLQDNGNNDGRAEPGETASVFITLGNQEAYQTATNVVGTLSSTDPTLTFVTPTVNYPDIPNGGTATNTTPFRFTVSSTAIPHPSSLHLHVVADPQQTSFDVDIPIYIGWPDVLLVDDDGLGTFETYYIPVLDSLDLTYEHWDVNASGVPPQATITGYPMMIWFTGFVSTNVFSTEEQNLIQAYLNGGGKLFLTGQNIAQALNSSAPDFLHNVLHANYGIANTQVRVLNGVTGNPVTNGMTLDCNAGGSGSGSATNPDGITVIAPADEALIYQGSTWRGGLTYEGGNNEKLVFFSIPFEAISGQNGTYTRWQVMQAIVNWFTPTAPPVTITLAPINPPIVIPASGGSFNFDITVTNNGTTPQPVDGWCMVTLPNGSNYGPVLGPIALTLPGSFSISRQRTQNIPGYAPAGNYSYNGYVGDYPGTIWDSDSFPFQKTAVGDGVSVSNWENDGESFQDPTLSATGDLPNGFILEKAHPNPFNPQTTLGFALPQASRVELGIYSISGALVAKAAEGWFDAGHHEIVFDASPLPSGVYLCRLTAGAFTATEKMIFLK